MGGVSITGTGMAAEGLENDVGGNLGKVMLFCGGGWSCSRRRP